MSHYKLWFDAQAKYRVSKGVVQKTRLRVNANANVKMQNAVNAVNAKMLTSIKFYVKLQQHFSTKIMYCYLNIAIQSICQEGKKFCVLHDLGNEMQLWVLGHFEPLIRFSGWRGGQNPWKIYNI